MVSMLHILVITFLVNGVDATDTYCYGFGKLMGTLDDYLDSDYEMVSTNKIGGGFNYLSSIGYFLDGRQMI